MFLSRLSSFVVGSPLFSVCFSHWARLLACLSFHHLSLCFFTDSTSRWGGGKHANRIDDVTETIDSSAASTSSCFASFANSLRSVPFR
uniref:Putative secreted protein n=1 Tax=Anopheles marajoara TaxID=58244 RepID=A0A2M4CA93_9DIPT